MTTPTSSPRTAPSKPVGGTALEVRPQHLPVHDHGAPVLRTHAEALAAAHALAQVWAVAGPQRDADRAVPHAELAALGSSGLLGLTVPVALGGGGLGTRTLTEVFAVLAAADTSLAQVPQNHFGTVYALPAIDDERRAFWCAEALRGARFGNANAEGKGPATVVRDATAADPDLADGSRPTWVMDGTKRFATGAMTADWVTVGLTHVNGWRATAMVPGGTAGITARSDWDAFGQRSTHSGTIEFDGVLLADEHLVDHRGYAREVEAFRYSRSQLTHPALQAGATQGVLDLARRWIESGHLPLSGAVEQWWTETSADLAAVRALVARAADLVDELAVLHEAGDVLDRDLVMRLGVAVDEAKVLAYELGPGSADALARLAPPLDPALDPDADELDRRWRNARTHALHDPVRWRRHHVGAYHLRGEFLPHATWLHTSATTPR